MVGLLQREDDNVSPKNNRLSSSSPGTKAWGTSLQVILHCGEIQDSQNSTGHYCCLTEFYGKILLQKIPGAVCTGFKRTDLEACSLMTRDALQASKREKQRTVLPSCEDYNSQCQLCKIRQWNNNGTLISTYQIMLTWI